MRGSIRHIFLLVFAVLAGAGGVLGQSDKVPPAQDQVLGTPADLESDEPAFLWLERGAEIRQSPEWESPVIAIVDIRLEVPVAQERGDWLLVRYAGWKGWIHRTGEREAEQVIPFSTAPDRKMLESALAILASEPEDNRTLGPFSLYTDLSEGRLLDFLDNVATNLPRAYAERYGLDPGEENLEAVVIFSREEDYRTYTRTTTDTPGLAAGHATQGIAVVAVGTRSRDEVAAVLVHELTHLLNRRLFRETEVPWLEEGMGNDLAYCRIRRRSGELELGSLGGRSVVIDRPVYLAGGESRIDREIRLEGPVASLSLVRDSNALLPLEILLDLQSAEYMDPLDLRTRYDQSTFLIRYMLDSGNVKLASGFRSYLQGLANGSGSEDVSLASLLGVDWVTFDRDFSTWLKRQRSR